MGYLDDPDFEFRLDPASERVNDSHLSQMLEELATRPSDQIVYVLEGLVRLKQHLPEADVAKCLDTSIIWMFG